MKEILHYPSLKTILMVEEALRKAEEYPTKKQLKEALPKKVMHQTLNLVLDYLEESNKIVMKGGKVIWIANNSPKLQKAIDEAIPASEVLRKIRENIFKE